MTSMFYQTLKEPELIGKNIVIPDSSHKALYLSENGELFWYAGICSKDKEKVLFKGWPYYLKGKHTKDCENHIKGFFRVKSGCILLTGFLDHEYHNNKKYKQLNDYVVHMPVVNSCYFGISKRIETESSWHFEEDEKLSRAGFGPTYTELEYLVRIYAERLGICNMYNQSPKITRSMNNDNFCDITEIWIPPKFPYIALTDAGYDFSHVSLYGFYRHVGALLSMGPNTKALQIFKHKTFGAKIINRIKQMNDYFPFEVKVTRKVVFP